MSEMNPPLKVNKFVNELPAQLEPDSVYFVRVYDGFSIYVTNSAGTIIAYTLNQMNRDEIMQRIKSMDSDYLEKPNLRTDTGDYEYPESHAQNGWPNAANGGWWHLQSTTHSNKANYYAMQTAASFFNNNGDGFYMRVTDGNGSNIWHKLITESNIAKYLASAGLLKYKKLEGFKWYKAFRLNNVTGDFTSGGERTTALFRILGQTDFGNTKNDQTAYIQGSFGIRGPGDIRPVLTTQGSKPVGASPSQYAFRIYEKDGDAWLYIRTPNYSDSVIEYNYIGYDPQLNWIAEFPSEQDRNTYGVIDPPDPGTLLWDSSTGETQEMYQGRHILFHDGNFDKTYVFNKLDSLQTQINALPTAGTGTSEPLLVPFEFVTGTMTTDPNGRRVTYVPLNEHGKITSAEDRAGVRYHESERAYSEISEDDDVWVRDPGTNYVAFKGDPVAAPVTLQLLISVEDRIEYLQQDVDRLKNLIPPQVHYGLRGVWDGAVWRVNNFIFTAYPNSVYVNGLRVSSSRYSMDFTAGGMVFDPPLDPTDTVLIDTIGMIQNMEV